MPALMEGTFPLPCRSPRVSKTMPVTMWETSTGNSEKWSGATLDLSDHGLRVVTGKSLHQGQIVSVFLSETGLCFRRCQVVWTRQFRVPQLSESGLHVLK